MKRANLGKKFLFIFLTATLAAQNYAMPIQSAYAASSDGGSDVVVEQ